MSVKKLFLAGLFISNICLGANFDVIKDTQDNKTVYTIEMTGKEQVNINENEYHLTVKEVADSRCPEHMSCWWEGGIVVDISLAMDKNETIDATLIYGEQSVGTDINGYSIDIKQAKKVNDTYLLELQVLKN